MKIFTFVNLHNTKIARKYLGVIIVGLFCLLLSVRYLVFVASHGGIEYDSGWFLSVARGLSEKGTYVTKVNSLLTEKRISPSLWERVGVQDNEGYVYFPAANSVGPGYSIPTAVLLKTFGFGYWQARAWPIAATIALFVLIFIITYYFGGYISAFVLFVILWSFPQLLANFFFEAFSEQIATLFLISGFVAFAKVKSNYVLATILGALLIGFSFITKVIMLSFFPVIILLYYWSVRERTVMAKILLVALCVALSILPIFTFEGFKYFSINSIFGQDGYRVVQADSSKHLLKNGSGFSVLGDFISYPDRRGTILSSVRKTISDRSFLWNSLFGINLKNYYWLVVFVILPIATFKLWISSTTLRYIVFAPYVQWLWFLVFADSGWARYVLPSIILVLVTLAISIGHTIKKIMAKENQALNLILLVMLLIFTIAPLFSSKTYFSPQLSLSWLNREHVNTSKEKVMGFPSLYIYDLKPQQEAVSYLQMVANQNDVVVVEGNYLAPEIVALTNKKEVVMERLIANFSKYRNLQKYLVYGPHLVGRYRRNVDEKQVEVGRERYCSEEIFENDGYFICRTSNEKIEKLLEAN